MPLLLSPQPGVVVAIEHPGPALPLLTVEGLTDAGGAALQSIVVGGDLARQPLATVTPSLGSDVYAYSFGERPGPLTVTGIAFAGMCPALGGPAGLAAIAAWYERHRIGAPGGGVRRVVLGGSYALLGLLRGLQLSLRDPDRQLSSFTLQFDTLSVRAPGAGEAP